MGAEKRRIAERHRARFDRAASRQRGSVQRREGGVNIIRGESGAHWCGAPRRALWSAVAAIHIREEVETETGTEVRSRLSGFGVWGQGRGWCHAVRTAPVVGARGQGSGAWRDWHAVL